MTRSTSIQIALVFIFLIRLNAFPQAFSDIEWYDTDSLQSVLPEQSGLDRMHTLNALAASFSFEDKEESRKFALSAMELARDLESREGVAAANRNLARMEFYDGNYPSALDYYQKALQIYDEEGNRYLVAQLLEDIATTHFYANNLEKTFELAKEALAVYRSRDENGKTIGDVRDTMSIYSRMGLPYRNTGRSDIAKKIYFNYIHLAAKHRFEITDQMLHLGLLAGCCYEIGEYDSAFYYFKRARAFPDVNMSIQALKREHQRRMGGIYLELGRVDTAILMYRTVLEWFSSHGFLKQSQLASQALGDIYMKAGAIDSANHYYSFSEQLLTEMIAKNSFYRYDSLKYTVSWGSELYLPFTKKLIQEVTYKQAIRLYDQMYKLNLERGHLKTAIEYLISCSDAKDTLRKLTANRESVEIQTRYETERKNAEILSLSRKNELNALQLSQTRLVVAGLGGLLLVIVFMTVVLIRQYHLKTSQHNLLLQHRLLRTQMNPHFMFNSIASIQNFIIKEKPALASDYLSRFTKLVRQILNNSAVEWVPLEDEISSIENYLALQKIRYRELFDYVIDIDEQLDVETISIPPMLAQPFIENSIEHGIKPKDSKGHIKFNLKQKDSFFVMEIEDDGVGRAKAKEIDRTAGKDHKSMATSITRKRINNLNKEFKKKIEFKIIDLIDDSGNALGTKVVFEIPLNLKLNEPCRIFRGKIYDR